MPNNSTVNQLVYLYHEFSKALDMQKEARVVFCDVSKAFDRVWHKGLISKLRTSGIEGGLLDWFQSYLHDRSQRVVIEGQSSRWGSI